MFEKILAELKKIETPDGETAKRIKSLKEILRLLPYNNRKFSNKENSRQDCWNCSDAILAVTAPAEADILNHNSKHYDPICRAINKQGVTYT